MARLFTALVPPEPVLDDLAAALGPLDSPLRAESRAGWHITLGFYGDGDDPVARTKWLVQAVDGLAAPRLRLHGFGTFPKVGWAGVEADDALDRLARAAGAGVERPYKPHLTLARWKQEEQERGRAALESLEGYSSPWWVATEVVLMASTRTAEGAVYTPVARCVLSGV
ncbi:RNA 2',3'-cyclic phosphodiesterase [Labedaea rhizosphaerae]|uniref:RNA 2',3'-cyclic phosphodiesterase n=1 Tax=Labedaea rhizosphaerae TaxID=598644 RepID=A0A4R6SCJ9_LABRH|nr:RNA 2',3'-cyclic phosphodiesterase [Labedaea rhizosphaerae]TDP97287.1 2'-5' RNA ligase [Labedaea rhizosphaerae]